MKSMIAICSFSLLWASIMLTLGVYSGFLTITSTASWLIDPAAFAYRHLRLSIVPFSILFLLYFWLMSRLKDLLKKKETPLSRLTFYDRLLNATIATFFGVGVIWTAIGMETALMQTLNGLGQDAEAVAKAGAWGLLEKLVNGGLLLALSTTVFGGICGYLLRLLKIIMIGNQWDRLILQENEVHE